VRRYGGKAEVTVDHLDDAFASFDDDSNDTDHLGDDVVWETVGDDVLVLDSDAATVYHLTGDLADEADVALASDISSRRAFMTKLAKAAGVGAVTALALPTAAAASSHPVGTSPPLINPQLLTVSLANSAYGSVTSSPVGINTASNVFTSSFEKDQVVTLTAVPNAGATTVWSGVDSSDGNTATVTMDIPKTVTVTFQYALTVQVRKSGNWPAANSNPSVTTDLGGISVTGTTTTYAGTTGTSVGTITAGETVTLTGSWTGTGGGVITWTNATGVPDQPLKATTVMDGVKTVSASFAK
jgi:hypothetical protein